MRCLDQINNGTRPWAHIDVPGGASVKAPWGWGWGADIETIFFKHCGHVLNTESQVTYAFKNLGKTPL